MHIKTDILIYGDLRVHIYYQETDMVQGVLDAKNLVVFLPGLPQTMDKSIAKRFVEEGKVFLWLHYYGSWFSRGIFSPSQCRQSLVDCMDMLRKKEVVRAYDGGKLTFSFKEIILVGNSFGAQVALTAPIDFSEISRISLFSPFLFAHKLDSNNRSLAERLVQKDLPFWRRGMDTVYRGIDSSVWETYFNGDDPLSLLGKSYSPMEVFVGADDSIISCDDVERFKGRYAAHVKYVDGAGHDFLQLYEKIHQKHQKD